MIIIPGRRELHFLKIIIQKYLTRVTSYPKLLVSLLKIYSIGSTGSHKIKNVLKMTNNDHVIHTL